jgi:error-prone DNA polymerase
MNALFHDLPEAIANTSIVSERLNFTLDKLGYEFPHYAVPEGETMDSFLLKRVDEGIRKRYEIPLKRHLLQKARAQAERELALIAKLGFAGYFLIVWDIVRYCQRLGFLVQGRGSAANSVVCYALELTAVDPVGMELLFERFLNESRNEWPDIDLDLPSGDERESVIQYLYERYGSLGAAMTANVITYRSRSVAREVGKALGFEEEQIERLSSLMGHWEWRGENDTMERRFAQAGFDQNHPRIAHYLSLCQRMKSLPRHLGQHSGGMVVCAGMLNRVVPIERASMPGRTVIQWDKEDCADLGLIKVDLLGLGMMAALKETIELIPRHYDTSVDLAALPEDPLVYETLAQGRHRRHVSSGESRADGFDSAQRADSLLRSRRAGGHHSPRPHRRQNDASVHAPPPRERRSHLSASFTGAGAEAHAWCSALSRATAAHGDGHRQLHWR